MWNSRLQLCVIVFFATGSCLFNAFHCLDDHHQPQPQPQSPPKVSLFVFGDSLLDPGNNNYINTTTDFQANFSPYGETFFKYPTGRFSDGRLIQDFIAEFANLPLISSYFKANTKELPFGVNFASGGAGALVETHVGKVVDMITQLSYFDKIVKKLSSKLGEKEVKKLLSNAVYLISLGGNDILSPNPIFDSFSQEEYLGIVIGNYTDAIKELHEKGARKFGFINMGPLGCLPYPRAHKEVVDGECDEKIMALSKLFNKAFSKKLKQLEKQLKGLFQYSNLDFFTATSDMIDNPSKYGFKEVKTACCGSGPFRGVYSCGGKRGIEEFQLCDNVEEYLFFDSYHPNERGHRLLAEQLWNGVPSIRGPVSLKSLFEH